MAATSFLRSLFLSYLSRPACDRAIFRSIARVKPQRIVEIGLAAGDRAIELIELAQRQRPTVEIRYTGLDMFDARPVDCVDGPLKIKEMHQELKSTGAKVKLVPGDPVSSIARVANELTSTDLLVISADLSMASLAQQQPAPAESPNAEVIPMNAQPGQAAAAIQPDWFYVPRMLHEHSAVYYQTDAGGPFELLDQQQVMELAASRRAKVA